MTTTHAFQVVPGPGPSDPVRLVGVIDENADLSFFVALTGHAQINLADVRRINSHGVRNWIDALRRVPSAIRLQFVECPPPIIDQINMVSGFLGDHELLTFYAPLECSQCGATREVLVGVSQARACDWRLPDTRCEKCGGDMSLDAVEEQYLGFLREA